MSDFIVALGLFFALEGLVLAAFPDAAKHMMKTVLASPNSQLRIAGVAVELEQVVEIVAAVEVGPPLRLLFAFVVAEQAREQIARAAILAHQAVLFFRFRNEHVAKQRALQLAALALLGLGFGALARIRRRAVRVQGSITFGDGRIAPITADSLLRPLERALRAASWAIVLLAAALAVARLS